jgi:hypothetical protein
MRHERKIHRPVDFVLAGRYVTPFKLQGFCKKRIIGSCNFIARTFVPFARTQRNKSVCILSQIFYEKNCCLKVTRHLP